MSGDIVASSQPDSAVFSRLQQSNPEVLRTSTLRMQQLKAGAEGTLRYFGLTEPDTNPGVGKVLRNYATLQLKLE